mmetsp:Transcript_6135/g.15523  ORF Transcript_6135/g.15523 Transcript_6135/m.15523 type:complete len:374 (-) Transcript_6135:168-1289(-)
MATSKAAPIRGAAPRGAALSVRTWAVSLAPPRDAPGGAGSQPALTRATASSTTRRSLRPLSTAGPSTGRSVTSWRADMRPALTASPAVDITPAAERTGARSHGAAWAVVQHSAVKGPRPSGSHAATRSAPQPHIKSNSGSAVAGSSAAQPLSSSARQASLQRAPPAASWSHGAGGPARSMPHVSASAGAQRQYVACAACSPELWHAGLDSPAVQASPQSAAPLAANTSPALPDRSSPHSAPVLTRHCACWHATVSGPAMALSAGMLALAQVADWMTSPHSVLHTLGSAVPLNASAEEVSTLPHASTTAAAQSRLAHAVPCGPYCVAYCARTVPLQVGDDSASAHAWLQKAVADSGPSWLLVMLPHAARATSAH